CSLPPISTSASRRAAAGLLPRPIFSSVRRSAYAAGSSVELRSNSRLRKRLRQRSRGEIIGLLLHRPQSGCDGHGNSVPLLFLNAQLAASRFGETVIAGSPGIFRFAPRRDQPAGLFHAVKGGEQRSRLHVEGAFRQLPNTAGNAKAVHLVERQSFQNQKIERSLQKIGG